MTLVAVVAHENKHLGGGLSELRQVLVESGITDPLWYEVAKSSEAPKYICRAIKLGADLIFVWGGDGMVQHSIDAVVDSGIPIAILPAGTANLLAANLGIPKDLAKAVDIGLHGTRRPLDAGVLNGERFGVMAGAGFDARIMGGVDQKLKERFGRLAYVQSSVQAMRARRCRMTIKVDGDPWFDGKASCVLFANVGTVTGGLKIFPDAKPDDGILEIGVVTAKGWLDWLRVLSRVVARDTTRSPMLATTQGRKISVRLERSMPYELDGGARKKTKKLKVRIVPAAVYVCVPDTSSS
ncbi:MAG: diacylglycerol/lipid kinase family protein [Ilumatobacteraceae bacterium]